MTKQNLVAGPLSRIINSPFNNFFEDFFGPSMPLQLIERAETFPKYNITRKNKETTDQFTVELAIAGFDKNDLKVFTEDNQLFIEGIKPEQDKIRDFPDYLYKGIAERNFKWSLKLPEYAEVRKTSLINGILSVDILINLPEEKKPKTYIIE